MASNATTLHLNGVGQFCGLSGSSSKLISSNPSTTSPLLLSLFPPITALFLLSMPPYRCACDNKDSSVSWWLSKGLFSSEVEVVESCRVRVILSGWRGVWCRSGGQFLLLSVLTGPKNRKDGEVVVVREGRNRQKAKKGKKYRKGSSGHNQVDINDENFWQPLFLVRVRHTRRPFAAPSRPIERT